MMVMTKSKMANRYSPEVRPYASHRSLDTRTPSEALSAITHCDDRREGFPEWTAAQFIEMLVRHYRIDPAEICNRIEFVYVDGQTSNETRKCASLCASQKLLAEIWAKPLKITGGGYRNRTGLLGFAIRCIACLPTRLSGQSATRSRK